MCDSFIDVDLGEHSPSHTHVNTVRQKRGEMVFVLSGGYSRVFLPLWIKALLLLIITSVYFLIYGKILYMLRIVITSLENQCIHSHTVNGLSL